MVALARELTMTSDPVRPSRIRADWFEDVDYAPQRPGQVRCLLHLGHTVVAIDVPADAVCDYKLRPQRGIQFEIPGESNEAVAELRSLSKAEQDWSDGWAREMESFDRF